MLIAGGSIVAFVNFSIKKEDRRIAASHGINMDRTGR